ncbi:MAG: translation initiation factor IF-2 [Candidatus Kuenenbacteria bacterium]
MNVTELARRLRITPNKLREIMPQLGFDIGVRAIKIDHKMAQDIIEKLSDLKIREKYLGEKIFVNASDKVFIDKKGKGEDNGFKKILKIPQRIVVKEMAKRMEVPVTTLIMELMHNGVMASLNQDIDFETAAIIAEDMGFKIEQSEENFQKGENDRLKELLKGARKDGVCRPPVIVVMGHVDHGKTKLLDAIRETNVVEGEAGGITQHIGAYQVEKDGRLLTFIDTPGHEAFSAMRSRGAKVADMAILVVAADDGVQPQTIEAISHIRQAELPFIVAINKIDKPEANVDKIKSDLANIDLTPEDWGGNTIIAEISAKERINIPDLLDTLFLIADLHKDDIIANPNEDAMGTIIESHIDKGEGPVATVLVQNGTLRSGNYINIGNSISKIRIMKDWKNNLVVEAMPSMPVKIFGLKQAPRVGDILQAVQGKKKIREISRAGGNKNYKFGQSTSGQVEVENDDKEENDAMSVDIILKADALGSIEAIIESFEKIKRKEVDIKVVKQGLGNITEKEVEQAASQGAHLIGFNVKASRDAMQLAVSEAVEIKLFSVIYDLLDMLKEEVERLIGERTVQVLEGKLKVLEIFRTEKKSQIVGGKVIEGKIIDNAICRLIKNGEIAGEIKALEIEAGKEKVKEVAEGQECGVKIEGSIYAEKGDVIEFYKEEIKI